MGSQMNRDDSFAPTKADIKFVVTDEYFLPTYGIKTVAGRNFSKDYGTDTSSFLINEAAVSALGLKSNEEVIGKPFRYGGRQENSSAFSMIFILNHFTSTFYHWYFYVKDQWRL